MFTTQQIFPPAVHPYGQRILIVKASGGSIQIDALLNPLTNEWINFASRSVDGAEVMVCGGSSIRITPSGGASFNLV